MKKSYLKQKLVTYAINYAAYVACVVVISLMMGRDINALQILAMAVVIVFALELCNVLGKLFHKLTHSLRRK